MNKQTFYKRLNNIVEINNDNKLLESVNYNFCILSSDQDSNEMKILKEWSIDNKVKIVKINFDELIFFYSYTFSTNSGVDFHRLVTGEVNGENVALTLDSKEYIKYINTYSNNYVLFKEDNELKMNNRFQQKLTKEGKVILVITGMENRLNNKFDCNKRRVILDFIRTHNFGNLLFSVCLISKDIDRADWYSFSCLDGKDQFSFLELD